MANLDLPAFGIRDLNGPESPPGIVQVTASQYDSTIRSQPDAVLSYIDLDDGELITVGSSFELQQRLEEPVPPSTSPVPSLVIDLPAVKDAREAKENTLVHIFDIRHTNRSLAVWRDHEAYTSKKLRDRDMSKSQSGGPTDISPHKASSNRSEPLFTLSSLTTQDKSDKSSTVPPQPTPVLDTTASNERNVDHSFTAQPSISSEGETSTQTDKTLASIFAGIESHLGPLADFLESTAEGLRKVAERTTEADPTPVESVLGGFKKILKEAGELGLELLATLDEELEKNRSSRTDAANRATPNSEKLQPPSLSAVTEKPRSEDKLKPDVEPSSKKVSFIEAEPTEPPATKPKPTLPQLLNRDSSSSKVQTVNLPPRVSSSKPQDPPTFGRPSSVPEVLFPSFSDHLMTRARFQSVSNSIIDSQPCDFDVLTRYPPLPSLRKAVSVSGLKGKSGPSGSYQCGLSTTSALSRYPSIGQFEEQSRAKSRDDLDSKYNYSHWRSPVWPFVPPNPNMTKVYKKPAVEDEDEPLSALQAELARKTKNPDVKDTPKRSSVSLPGAWPEQKREDAGSRGFDTTAATSDMSKDILPKRSRDPVTDGLPQPTSSPIGTTYSRGPIFPRKSQTVSGTNPAARLNGPFDPLAHIPVPQSRLRRSQPDLSASNAGFTSTKSNPVLPDSLAQRSQTVHHTDRYKPRDATPFQNSRLSHWENYLKNNLSTTTNSSVTYSPSWNPSPEESERSVFLPSIRLHRPEPLTTRPPTVSIQKPVRPLSGTQPVADKSMHSPMTGSAPTSSVPRLVRAPQPETLRVGPKISTTSKPSPPIAPAPLKAAATFPTVSAASGIYHPPSNLSPCRPASTRVYGRSGISPVAPLSSMSTDECVKALKVMGFGRDDPNELARLSIYAAAAGGDVEAAIEFIEDDREARDFGRQIGSTRDLGKDADVEQNPWED